MRFACAILVIALAQSANAQQQGTTITLACNGTAKLTATAAADMKPDTVTNLGIIVDIAGRTVTVMDYVTPIRGITATNVSFSGQQSGVISGVSLKPFTISGSIDRVTGHTTIDWSYSNVGDNSAWELTCRPATRLF
ncbi:hypothetical protein [Bradyrhizobium cosmicum]|uniref:hypothetical protein n=1 Tax=Bradyrhizobium cosmicum TaxID=1404864 RepID=UPI0028EEC1ED|nr:hypothetical protein [Bradyrhizobium cosmicum]